MVDMVEEETRGTKPSLHLILLAILRCINHLRAIRLDFSDNVESVPALADVPEEYVFRCCDGQILRNMKELGDALNTMTDETYVFHANTEKNDFANWARDIIKDEMLAKDLQKAPNRAQAAKLVASRMAILSKRLA